MKTLILRTITAIIVALMLVSVVSPIMVSAQVEECSDDPQENVQPCTPRTLRTFTPAASKLSELPAWVFTVDNHGESVHEPRWNDDHTLTGYFNDEEQRQLQNYMERPIFLPMIVSN